MVTRSINYMLAYFGLHFSVSAMSILFGLLMINTGVAYAGEEPEMIPEIKNDLPVTNNREGNNRNKQPGADKRTRDMIEKDLAGDKRFINQQKVSYANDTRSRCSEKNRQIYNTGRQEIIYVSPNKWPEVKFPKKIAATLPENPKGLDIRTTPFGNNLFFGIEDENYRGKVLVHTVDGTSYHLLLIGKPYCADLTVTIVDEETDQPTMNQDEESRARKRGLRLVDYMYLGKPPTGYRVEVVPGPKKERLVFRQGPVHFYVKEIWHGQNRTGTVLLVENHGRTPFRVAIESIDYRSPAIIEALGYVREVTMMPTTRRLGPAPEFAIDQAHPAHQGLIFIDSQKPEKRYGG